ncbi:MAG: hypothetical protein K1X55_16470, partial [Chitinophagales bacterium]|nr:hypothetical protein [Chitinophagales bacterium]
MKRNILFFVFAFLLFGFSGKLDAQILFQEDFDGVGGGTTPGTYSFPSGWFLRNVDNKTPNTNVSYVNEAW